MSALTQFARRIDAATPPQRDRAVDALRALAIAGVIGGHWLVTALVSGAANGHTHGGTVLRDDSPLATMPWLTPLSWVSGSRSRSACASRASRPRPCTPSCSW